MAVGHKSTDSVTTRSLNKVIERAWVCIARAREAVGAEGQVVPATVHKHCTAPDVRVADRRRPDLIWSLRAKPSM